MLNKLKRGMRSARRRGEDRGYATQIEHLEERQLLSGSPSPTALTPAEISAYYGFNDITFTEKLPSNPPPGTPKGPSRGTITVPGNGNGQTIALIDWYQDPNIQNDVNVFDQQFGLPPCNLTVDTLASVPKTFSNSWAEEESIDVEWAHAVAPAANIVVVNCGTSTKDILGAVSAAANYPNVSVVSMSFGISEFKGELSDDSDFITPSNHGDVYVSFVASSGDDKSSTAVGPQWPAVSPNVFAVGGTNLIPTTNGGYDEESWDDSQGGPSIHEAEPLYQYSVQRSGVREDPDVAYSAVDFAYYDSFSATSAAPPDWAHSSGTSYGAPQWAGLIAIANQGRTLAGETTLGVYIPSAIYAMPSSDFNDITTGPANREGYAPGPGYDEITGRGSPKANLLVPDLVAYNPVIVIPPFPIHPFDVSTESAPTTQVPQNTAVAASSPASPIDTGTLDESAGSAAVDATPGAAVWNDPTAGNSGSAPLTPSDGGSSGGMSSSTIATQTASVNDRISLPLMGAVARPALGDGPSADPSTASLNIEGIHWAGLNAAIDILSA